MARLTSYDLNFRSSLWVSIWRHREIVKRSIVRWRRSSTVMIGNEEDFTACLGLHVEGLDDQMKDLPIEGYEKMIAQATSDFPNFQAIATTLRTVKTASINDWCRHFVVCWGASSSRTSRES